MKRIISILAVCIGMASCSQAQQQQQQESRTFRLPEIPAILTTPTERAAYLAVHYWDCFDFADTALISLTDVTEQAFVDFISVLPYTDRANVAVDTLFRRASAKKEMLHHFMELSDKYLYEPNSPMHNEELYILALRSIVDSPALTEIEKSRPRHRLEMALKNRPGHVAADFTVTCRDGKRRRLSDIKAHWLLLYFNDPECDDCRRVKQVLMDSRTVNGLIDAGRLKVLSVCVEGKTPAWERTAYPARWIDGYDEGQRLTTDEVYDLKAMPTLYLLDAEKRVLLKDASMERIEEWLLKPHPVSP